MHVQFDMFINEDVKKKNLDLIETSDCPTTCWLCGERGKETHNQFSSHPLGAVQLTALSTLYLGSSPTSPLFLPLIPILPFTPHLPCPHTSCSGGPDLHPMLTQFTWGFSLTLKSADTLPVWSCQISASPSFLTQSTPPPFSVCQYLCVSLTSFSISRKIADSVRETESSG